MSCIIIDTSIFMSNIFILYLVVIYMYILTIVSKNSHLASILHSHCTSINTQYTYRGYMVHCTLFATYYSAFLCCFLFLLPALPSCTCHRHHHRHQIRSHHQITYSPLMSRFYHMLRKLERLVAQKTQALEAFLRQLVPLVLI